MNCHYFKQDDNTKGHQFYNINSEYIPYDKNCPPFDDLVNSFKALFSKVFKPVTSIQTSEQQILDNVLELNRERNDSPSNYVYDRGVIS